MYGTSRITDIQKIGLGLMGFGGIFLFLGILLLFDSALLALGNAVHASYHKISVWDSCYWVDIVASWSEQSEPF
ncbi:uncharacterized protein DEA37_0002609 [Paragonimus westermani]|uniref:Uncharacterized protein n=1 Tax=Paragonimus westermani TaxID=34504 RepID=A0A5J4NN81_9TREM|nr:uncharacterized protein DEA37_0002609 [Paragonimus westermani]